MTEEDVAHVALIDYLRNFDEGLCSSQAFIGRSIMHEVDRLLKARKTHFVGLPNNVVDIANSSSLADELLSRQEDFELVRELLSYLAEREPEIYEYADLILTDENIKRSQVAAMLGVHPTRIDYLKKRLRQEMENFLASGREQNV